MMRAAPSIIKHGGQPTQIELAHSDQLVSTALTGERFYAILLGLFSGLGLSIVTVGVYGVISYFVVQHTHEIGVRMALGATPGGILRMVLMQGLGLTCAGIIAGMGASYTLTGFLRGMLVSETKYSPVVCGENEAFR